MPLRTRRPGANPSYQLLDLDDLTGGMDIRSSPTQMGANKARKLINWSLRSPGELTVRKGYEQFSTSSLGANRMQGGRRVYLSSYTFTLAAFNGQIYQPTDTGAWDSSGGTDPVHSTVSPTNAVFFPNDRDLVAIFDAANQPVKSSNGSSWTQMGITPRDGRSTLAAGASSGGLLANEYEVKYTYRDNDQGHESNGSESSTITLGSTGSLAVEVRGSSDPQVDVIRIYARNITAGESVLRLVSTLANVAAGSTTSSTISSSDWQGNVAIPDDHDVPPVLSFGVVWKNRWWGRNADVGNRLHFTQVFLPQAWPATFFLDIPFERGDSIKAIIPIGDTLLVFGHDQVFLIIGQTSLDFEVRPALSSQDGAFGPRAVEVIENGVVHCSDGGVFIFDGASDRLLSFDIEPGWRDLIDNATAADLNNIAVVYHEKEREVRIAVPRLFPTAGAGEWVLDLNRTREQNTPAWTQTDRNVGGYIHWNGAEADLGNRGRVFSWTDTSAILFEESKGQTANSSDFTAEYEGPSPSLGLSNARFIDKHGEYEPHQGAFTLETLVDGKSQGARAIGIGSGLALYGVATYGNVNYGGAGRRKYHQMLPASAHGRSVTEVAVYTGQEAFKWFTHSFGISPERSVRGFSE